MNIRNSFRTAALAATVPLAFGMALAGAGTASAVPVTATTTVEGNVEGFQTSTIVLPENTEITFAATGEASWDVGREDATVGPTGSDNLCLGGCPLDFGTVGALVVKIGDADPVAVGDGITLTGTGPVSYAFNDTQGAYGDNGGSFTVVATFDDGTEPVPEQPCIDFGSSCLVLPFSGS